MHLISLGRLLGIHGRALLVILGQTALLAIAWALFFVVILRGPTPLAAATADFAQSNPRIVTIIITLLATIFSALSSLYVIPLFC